MRLLALDTTSEFGSLALLRDEEVLEEALLHSAEGFSQVLFEHVGRLLERAGWKAEDVDCFAAAAGPGSFTGVRVGLAAAKGLAEALGKRAAGVSNLQAVAWFGSAPLRATVLDARRGQIYGAVYDASLRVVSPEVVARFTDWLGTLPPGELEFLSTDWAPFRGALDIGAVQEVPRALARAIGRIALERLRAGDPGDPAALDANYVRRSDAELYWKE